MEKWGRRRQGSCWRWRLMAVTRRKMERLLAWSEEEERRREGRRGRRMSELGKKDREWENVVCFISKGKWQMTRTPFALKRLNGDLLRVFLGFKRVSSLHQVSLRIYSPQRTLYCYISKITSNPSQSPLLKLLIASPIYPTRSKRYQNI